MKVIFLDIDGVLVTRRSHLELGFNHAVNGMTFDPDCVQNLKEILKQTKAKIVVSSSWRGRYVAHMKRLFAYYGFRASDIAGITPRIIRKDENGFPLLVLRGEEIEKYISNNNAIKKPVSDFVIIDDDADMGNLLPRLVQTNYSSGIDEQIKMNVVTRLGG